MDSLRLFAALAVATVGLLLAGAVYSLVVLLLTSQRVLPSLVVLVLVSTVVLWLVLEGIRNAGSIATTYW